MIKKDKALGKTTLKPPADSKTKVYAKQAIVNVFFDGTLNNYYNANKRNDDSSYGNDLSNVARMWASIRKFDIKCAVYIDGIGTTRFQEDTMDGYAYGDGGTGVMARADSAFAQIHEKVWKGYGQTIPPVVRINVFGFSRGAATARTFVHWFNTERQQRFKENADKWQGSGCTNQLSCRFVRYSIFICPRRRS